MQTEVYRTTIKKSDPNESALYEGENSVLREELGLPELKRNKSNSDIFQFRQMSEEEGKVFGFLFPCSTVIEDYNEFIPNEVLEAYKEFKDTCPYRVIKIKVMHVKTYDPDPLLVADVRIKDSNYDFPDAQIIIARWGDALEPFEKLREKAVKLWKAARLASLKKIQRQVSMAIEEMQDIDTITNLNTPIVYNID